MKSMFFTLLLAGSMLATTAASQNRKIAFDENQPWAEVIAKAAKGQKIIFMDCYTTWCGPCKMLDRDVFTNDDVADRFNATFVNAKYDMEKGEGVTLAKEYGISAYPTLLFIDPQTQEVIHRVAGARGVEDMLEQARIATNPAGNMQGIKKLYEADKTAENLELYLKAMRKGAMSDEINNVVVDYLKNLSLDEMMQERNWKLFEDNVIDPLSEPAQRVFANRAAFSAAIGTGRVNPKLSSTLMIASNRFRAKEADPVPNFDQARLDALVAFISKTDDAASASCLAQLNAANYAQHGEYAKMIEVLSDINKHNLLPAQMKPTFLMSYLTKLIGRKGVEKQAVELIDQVIAGADDGQNRAAYYQIKAMMLDSYGDKEGAEKAKAEAQKIRDSGEARPRMMQMG